MKRVCLAVFIIGLSLLFSGCGDSGTTEVSGGGKKITIGLLPKTKGSPYFTSCYDGAKEAAAELGDVELIYDGPTDDSAEKQASLIEQWTLKNVNAIAVSPNNPAVVAAAMKSAKDKGISVLAWDADGAADTRSWFVNQATAQAIGYAMVDTMAKDLGGDGATGEVAIVTASLTAANQNEWIKYMTERLAKYPGLKLVATKPSNDNSTLALQVTQDLMKTYPELKGVFAITSVAFPAAADAIKQAGKSGKVLVTGLGTPNNMKPFVKDGTVKSVVLWNTKDLGYLTVYAAHAAAKGELKAGAGTFKAGRLGERTISGDNILLGDYLVFTKDNIDKYDF